MQRKFLTTILAFSTLLTTCAAHAQPRKTSALAKTARGCSPSTGECWVKLATVVENTAADEHTPVYVTHKFYVGEPYPTKQDAVNGALYLLHEGSCTDEVHIVRVESVEVILSDGNEPQYPAFSDCYE